MATAKLIASSAETAYISNQTLGIEKDIECSDVSNYTREDYASCKIKFVDGKAKIKLIGQVKFEGMAVCAGTKEEAEVVEECPLSAVEKIESLATETNTEGLELTSDGNIRYTGSSPKNYIKFNDEDWRIIGTFTVTTASGSTEKLMKIVRNSQFSTGMSWDSSSSDVNRGYGVNEWSQADLMTMLNTYYIGTSTTCSYCSEEGQSTCSNDCSSSITPIGSTYTPMIEEVVWNTGAFSWGTIPVETTYNAERGTTTGKICTSDYGYASTDTSCRANICDILNSPCENTNWLHSGSHYWTLSPYATSSSANNAWYVVSGYVNGGSAYDGYGVRPAIYLKSDVSITSGDGSSSLPYQISM